MPLFSGSAYNELNDHKMNVVNILFTVAINIAIAIVIFVFLFLVFLKTFSKLCFGKFLIYQKSNLAF